MTVSLRLRAALLAGACGVACVAFPASVSAQTTPPTGDDCAKNPSLSGCATAPTVESGTPGSNQSTTTDDTNDSGSIIVTGTNIRQPNLVSPVPVTSVTAANLLSGGNLNLGDALNDLPALRGTFSQSNSTRFIGTAGVNFLDLRGLGTSRTLVLVDGRRHITASAGDYLVDTNTIPSDLLERVDIVTGGSSAVYGTDAIAGVVNFVLKQNFDGLKVSGQGGISSRKDRGSYYGSLVYGKNFAEGRGNIAIAGEYSQANALYNTDRDAQTGAFSGRNQFNLQENTGLPAALHDGIPDDGFYTGVRNGSISDGGELTAVCAAANLANTARCRASGFAQRYMFQPDGSLQLSNPSIDFRDITGGVSSNTVGGLGSTLQNTGQLDPGLQRYTFNLLGHYEVSPAFVPYIEAKYVHIRAVQEGQPSFFQGSIPAFFGGGADLRCNNPFLSAQALTTLQSIGRCANPATGTFTISRFNTDFGGRQEIDHRQTYRIVGGVRGNFWDSWSYDVSANYGHFKATNVELNNLLLFNQAGTATAGFLNAINAVRNAAGQIVCQINQVTVTDPNCVPISLFGSGNATLTPAALRYINTTSYVYNHASELDIVGKLNGDLGKLFTLPGGPVAFSVGGEYRRETAFQGADPLSASGATFFNSFSTFDPPALKSKEAFAEIEIPLLKDRPFFHQLSLNGAGRYSHYNTSGGVSSYNGGVVYAPARDIMFRFNYARSVRVPTQSDLYATPGQTFGFIADPCDVANRMTGTQFRDANCTAAGVPEGFVNTPARTQSLSYLAGGNPNLKPEKSDSYTLGTVIQPHWLPGFAVTVDYYKIKVGQLIETLDAQTIVTNCYDQPTLNNPYCPLVFRNATTHEFANPAVLAGPVNFARQQTRGIDVNFTYNHHFHNGDIFTVSANGTWTIQRDNYLSVTDPNFVSRQLSNLGDPKWEAVGNFDYQHGPFTLHYKVHFIGHQYIGSYADYYSLNGQAPQEPEFTSPNRYPTVWYHDLKATYSVNDHYDFYIGCDNVTDKLPPYGLSGVTDGSSIYDNIGRFFYAGFKINY